MDHQSAIDRRFAERYLLSELSPDEAAEFEAHFFECAECAAEVRLGAHLAANVRVVLREVECSGPKTTVEFQPGDQFLDLTIALEPSERAPSIDCQFQFAAWTAPLVVAATVDKGSIRLRLPIGQVQQGACSVVLLAKDSRRPLGRRELLIAKRTTEGDNSR